MLPSLLLTLLAGPAIVQEAPAEPELKARTTVLHLEGGAVLRMRARELADGAWEVFERGEWKRLPDGAVQRARPESELLGQAQELARAVPRGDLVRRVAYADWLTTEGLREEALVELERVLDQDPDQTDAIALIARARYPLALPAAPVAEGGQAALDAFFTAGARASQVEREVLVRRLGDAPEIPGLRAALAKDLTGRTPGRRTFAALALRRLFPGSEAELLLGRAVLDSAPEVRTGAALALKAFADPAVVEPALRAVGSKSHAVRTNAVEALGNMGYPEAVEPLFNHLLALQGGGSVGAPRAFIFTGRQRAYVQDFDVEVAQNQSIADPVINILMEGQVLDGAVIGVTEYVLVERAAVRRSLAKLTGANPGSTTAAWQRWWNENGAEWQAGAKAPKGPTTPSGRG